MMTPSHGPLFDTFRGQSGNPHGGAEFDEGFTQGSAPTEHGGLLFDQFATRSTVDKHGEHWDEFGWQDMPTRHGQHFDDAFRAPEAHGTEHGTWYDAFRGGAEVRCMIAGADVEGVVIDCTPEMATICARSGQRTEVDYGQITAWRTANAGRPSRETKVGGMHKPETDTSVVGTAPSSPSLSARGGGERSPVVPDMGVFANKIDVTISLDGADIADVVKAAGMGRKTGAMLPRPAIPAQERVTADAASRVSNHPPIRHGGFSCRSCGHADYRTHPVIAKNGAAHPTMAMHGCVNCGAMHPVQIGKTEQADLDVLKDVDTTETATQAQDLEGDRDDKGKQSGAKWCPTCKHTCRDAKDGRCPTCGGKVAVRKSIDDTLDVLKGLAA